MAVACSSTCTALPLMFSQAAGCSFPATFQSVVPVSAMAVRPMATYLVCENYARCGGWLFESRLFFNPRKLCKCGGSWDWGPNFQWTFNGYDYSGWQNVHGERFDLQQHQAAAPAEPAQGVVGVSSVATLPPVPPPPTALAPPKSRPLQPPSKWRGPDGRRLAGMKPPQPKGPPPAHLQGGKGGSSGSLASPAAAAARMRGAQVAALTRRVRRQKRIIGIQKGLRKASSRLAVKLWGRISKYKSELRSFGQDLTSDNSDRD